jgi:hypothetical protein
MILFRSSWHLRKIHTLRSLGATWWRSFQASVVLPGGCISNTKPMISSVSWIMRYHCYPCVPKTASSQINDHLVIFFRNSIQRDETLTIMIPPTESMSHPQIYLRPQTIPTKPTPNLSTPKNGTLPLPRPNSSNRLG